MRGNNKRNTDRKARHSTVVGTVPCESDDTPKIDTAFELALPLAELNEIFELITDARFAYGSLGREPDIPGNAKLRYEVHLISVHGPPNYGLMSAVERRDAADKKRESGNFYYKRAEYFFAVNSYNKALEILTAPYDADYKQDGHVTGVDFGESVHNLEIKLGNNLAATQIKIEAFEAAIKSCDSVLLRDPKNFKALYRKAKALVGLGEASKAVELLNKVLVKFPSDRDVLTELQRARVIMKQERERWSRASSRLFPDGDLQNRKRQKIATSHQRWRMFSVFSKWGASFIVIAVCVACIAVMVSFFYPEQVKRITRWVTNN